MRNLIASGLLALLEDWDGHTSAAEYYNFAVTGDLWNLVRIK